MNERDTDLPDAGSRFLAYLQLVRLPNLFTAMADVTMGFLFTRGFDAEGGWQWGLLLAASTLLYAGGVALNDVLDYPVDCEERPERPLPSGAISLAAGRWLAIECLLLGMLLSWAAAYMSGRLRPGIVGTLLVIAIVLYDSRLKRTPLGPLGMGACRFLNVLLGMSLVRQTTWGTEHWLVAATVGTYITGVTWLARHEAGRSSRVQLALATGVMLAGVALLGSLPLWTAELGPLAAVGSDVWYKFMTLLGLLIGWRAVRAVIQPQPHVVQMAVQQAILSLVMLDAAACFAAQGQWGAMAVLTFLLPTMLLGQLLRMT
jgi:4-hydroxybenzoate polyprenyltransferase